MARAGHPAGGQDQLHLVWLPPCLFLAPGSSSLLPTTSRSLFRTRHLKQSLLVIDWRPASFLCPEIRWTGRGEQRWEPEPLLSSVVFSCSSQQLRSAKSDLDHHMGDGFLLFSLMKKDPGTLEGCGEFWYKGSYWERPLQL